MKALPSFSFFVLASVLLLAGSQLYNQNYTVQQANFSLAQAESYISSVNQSSYLVFSPNLSTAYSYLNRAQELQNSSPTLAVSYAQLATTQASIAYGQISSYKRYAALITLFLTAWVGALLYVLMKPSAKSDKRRFNGR